jgi:hypothetical protein
MSHGLCRLGMKVVRVSVGATGAGDGEGDGEGDGDGDGDGDGEGEGDGDGEGVGDGDGVGVGEGDGVGDGEGDGEGVGDDVGAGTGVGTEADTLSSSPPQPTSAVAASVAQANRRPMRCFMGSPSFDAAGRLAPAPSSSARESRQSRRRTRAFHSADGTSCGRGRARRTLAPMRACRRRAQRSIR